MRFTSVLKRSAVRMKCISFVLGINRDHDEERGTNKREVKRAMVLDYPTE